MKSRLFREVVTLAFSFIHITLQHSTQCLHIQDTEVDAGYSRDLQQQADIYREDPGAGGEDPALPDPVCGQHDEGLHWGGDGGPGLLSESQQ